MPFVPHLARKCALLASLLPCATLSACISSPISLTQAAPPCAAIVESSQLLAPTPGTSLPAGDTVGEIAAFGVRQTSKLEMANLDKVTAARVLSSCDAKWREAIRDARPRRWYQVWR